MLGISFDEIADGDVEPFGGWGEGTNVTVIRPSMDLHDPMVVEPGLIRIAMDYGWMRAGDVIDVPQEDKTSAKELSDRITLLRSTNWRLAHFASGWPYLDPFRGFTDFMFAGISVGKVEIRTVPTPDALDDIRRGALLRGAACGRPQQPGVHQGARSTARVSARVGRRTGEQAGLRGAG